MINFKNVSCVHAFVRLLNYLKVLNCIKVVMLLKKNLCIALTLAALNLMTLNLMAVLFNTYSVFIVNSKVLFLLKKYYLLCLLYLLYFSYFDHLSYL